MQRTNSEYGLLYLALMSLLVIDLAMQSGYILINKKPLFIIRSNPNDKIKSHIKSHIKWTVKGLQKPKIESTPKFEICSIQRV